VSIWVSLLTGISVQVFGWLAMRKIPSIGTRILLPLGFSIIVLAIVSIIIPALPIHYRLAFLIFMTGLFSYAGTAQFNTHYSVLQSVFLVFFGLNAIAAPLIRHLLPTGLLGMILYIGVIISVLVCEFYLFIIASELLMKRIDNDTK
jgi:hypothetical protein